MIESFNFKPGTVVARKYEIVSLLGAGWEGEVYMVRERRTKIERSAKFFFPHRNIRRKASTSYAQRLHKLRHCPIVIPYHVQEEVRFRKQEVVCLVSEYVEGEMLSAFILRQPGKRLSPFQALHLLHTLTVGVESIHACRDYHGDLHTDNVLIKRFGLRFELKVLDLFNWGSANKENLQDDICDLIKIFHEALGGNKTYRRQPKVVKGLCCGLKRSLILKKFPTVKKLREQIEKLSWD